MTTLKDEHVITVPVTNFAAKKPLPKSRNRSLTKALQKKREDRSVGERLQGATALLINNFSFSEIGKRAKGLSLILLFVFTVLDIFVLPSLVYPWANFTIFVFSLIIFGFLFLMGITNKNGAAAYFATLAFFIIWSIIGFIRIIGYYHVSLPPYWLIIILSLLSLVQLELFRPRNRRRRFLKII